MTTDRDPDLERFREAMRELGEANERSARSSRELRETVAALSREVKAHEQ